MKFSFNKTAINC